jgi:excisionase family DNA binding protein
MTPGRADSPRLEDLPDVMTVKQCSQVFHVSPGLIYSEARQRHLPSVRLGRRLLIPKSGLLRWLDGGPPAEGAGAPDEKVRGC